MPRHVLPLLLLCLAPAVGHAQSALGPDCAAPEHRQFDFWVGSWTVTDSTGRVLGENDVVRIASGCGLSEHWRGARGGEGMSLNVWQPALGQWTQFWVGTGVVLELTGGLDAEDRMVLEGERRTPDGPLLDRIAWTPLPTGEVRQRWDTSRDGGESWQPLFDGMYRPRSSPLAAARTGSTRPSDVASPEAVVRALYRTVNRRPGERFDWDRLRTLFLPHATMIPSRGQTGGEFRVLTVDGFIEWVDEHTAVGGPGDQGFREEEVASRVEQYGDIAHVFSTYQKRFWGAPEVLGRGINSIQLVRTDGRWWIVSVAWDEESDAGPLPERYTPAGR